jgi:hypothetical protein
MIKFSFESYNQLLKLETPLLVIYLLFNSQFNVVLESLRKLTRAESII